VEIDAGQLADLLSREYGIAPTAIVDAPRGFVAATFDVRALDGRRYFVKVLPLWADAAAALDSLPVLEALHTLGIETISRPVRTRAGDLSTTLDELPTLVLEFIEGRSGEALDDDFEAYVRLLARLHQATVLVKAAIRREEFQPSWAAKFERFFARALQADPSTPPRAETRRLVQQHQAQIERDWATLASLAEACRQATWTPRITHGDAHGDNVIVGNDARLYLVDWDALLLAPAERDTWFFLNDEEQAASFLPMYRQAFPAYRPDPLMYRFYLFVRFFEDLLGYLVNIAESPSLEEQRWNLAELEQTCFRWLWPPMRRSGRLAWERAGSWGRR
jgi:spectinomycin phosphotransferase